MSFAINPSLTHIDIPEANILKLYRSKNQVQLAGTRFRNNPCEAYICVYKVDKKVSARVALLETGINSIYVYTSDFSAEQSSDYPKVLAEAQEFTASFGFTMEKVNLDFSPAMREVIIKGISVMRPPKKRVKLRSHSNTVITEMNVPEPGVTNLLRSPATPELDLSAPAAMPGLLAELSSAKTLIEKITREKSAIEQNAAREIARLKAAAEKANESKTISESRLLQEIEALKTESLADTAKHADEQIKRLERDLAAVETSESSLKKEVSRLSRELANIAGQKLQLEEKLSAEQSSAAETIQKLTAEISSLNAQLSAEKNLAADKIATLALFETSWRESQQREEELRLETGRLQQQLHLLQADLEKHQLKENRENDLLLKIATLEQEAEESRKTIELTVSTPDLATLQDEIKTLNAAKNDVENEYIRMANEAMEKEAELLENLYLADTEILRLTRELELQQQIAKTLTEPLPAAPTEIPAEVPGQQSSAPLELAATAEAAAIVQPAVVPGHEQSRAEDDSPDETIAGAPEIINGLLNEFGSLCGNSGHLPTEFSIDYDKTMIEYSHPSEVLAILYSSNSVQAVPDGSTMQRCKGYVIALKKADEYKAYLAWYLTESDKVVICIPDKQPADATECTLILQDAIAYFEIVGFMMEIAELGHSVKSYNRAISKVPALVRRK